MTNQTLCPCGSNKTYAACCEPYLTGERHAETPEACLRSRYTAHVKGNAAYSRDSLSPETRHEFNEKEFHEWAEKSEWLGLNIMAAKGNTVEFTAKYRTGGKILEHHEVATFRKDAKQERYYFVDGEAHVHEEGKGHEHHAPAPKAPVVREAPKIGRNDPCSCGSGKKYKKCCAA